MNVLVCVPYRAGTPRVFVEMVCQLFVRLTWPGRELALYPNRIPAQPKRYGAHAIARNDMLANCLTPLHTHVLWLDADLVSVPDNIIERLASVSDTAIVAPFVYVEKVDARADASQQNGGWFYDTGGFIRNGLDAQQWFPIWPDYFGGTTEMDSVGCCYLMPADVFRRGARYWPRGDEVEHDSFMREAKRLGYRILATDEVCVEHAFLPKYGDAWGRL